MNSATKYLVLLLVVVFSSCKEKSYDDIILEGPPGDYSIDYSDSDGLFFIHHNNKTDTISLWDNWAYVLYRYRQQLGDVSREQTYDEFIKSSMYCLPGGEKWYALMEQHPDSVYLNSEGPALCDCYEGNLFNDGSTVCQKKFQVYRSSYDDSISWYYAFYRDVCAGIDTSRSFGEYKDSVMTRAQRAEMIWREKQRIEDSIYATYPLRQCSGTDYVPPFKRVSSFRIYEPCRAMVRNPDGRCSRH